MMLQVTILIISSFAFTSAKALYIEPTSRPESINLRDNNEIFRQTRRPNSIPSGVDFSQEHLNSKGSREMFTNPSVQNKLSDHQIVFSRHGLIFDWPRKRPFLGGKYLFGNYILSNSGFLTHLNNVQDFVLVPQEYIYNIAGRTYGLVDNTQLLGWRRQSSSGKSQGMSFVPVSTNSFQKQQGILNVGTEKLNGRAKDKFKNDRNEITALKTSEPFETHSPAFVTHATTTNTKEHVVKSHADVKSIPSHSEVYIPVEDEPVIDSHSSLVETPLALEKIHSSKSNALGIDSSVSVVDLHRQTGEVNTPYVASGKSVVDSHKPVMVEKPMVKTTQKKVIIRPVESRVLEHTDTTVSGQLNVGENKVGDFIDKPPMDSPFMIQQTFPSIQSKQFVGLQAAPSSLISESPSTKESALPMETEQSLLLNAALSSINLQKAQPHAVLKAAPPLIAAHSLVANPASSLSEAVDMPLNKQMINKDSNSMNIHNQNDGHFNERSFIELRGASLPNHSENTEIQNGEYAPLREIFGGDALFRPKMKLVQLFPLTDKQEALMRFEG